MTFGLSQRDVSTIQGILRRYPSVQLVRIFGSRSKKTQHTGSDIDMAVMNSDVNWNDLLRLRSDLDDSDLPYTVDVVYYPNLRLKELKEHIDKVGKVFYEA